MHIAPIEKLPDPVNPNFAEFMLAYLQESYDEELTAILLARDEYRYYAVKVDTIALIYECPWIGPHVTYIYLD